MTKYKIDYCDITTIWQLLVFVAAPGTICVKGAGVVCTMLVPGTDGAKGVVCTVAAPGNDGVKGAFCTVGSSCGIGCGGIIWGGIAA